MLGHSRPAAGQPRVVAAGIPPDRSVPTQAYHVAFIDFYDGDYRAALEHFKENARGAIKTWQSRWINSICYETMQGECHYQMGQYPEALGHYTAALELYLKLRHGSPRWPFSRSVLIPPSKKPPPWQVRPLQAPLGQLPPNMLLGQGQPISATLQQGGVVQPPNLYPVEPAEIVRCTALAIRRRGELLGPLAAHDPMIDNLITSLQRRPGQPNHWSEAWVNLELGLALSAGGRTAAAIPVLQKATLASGELEHPLTAMAHLELGRLSMASGDFTGAAAHFEEASYASYYFTDVNHLPDLGVMEEAFRFGALNHLLANGKGVFPPLLTALPWAKVNRCRQLYVSLLNAAAENQTRLGSDASRDGACWRRPAGLSPTSPWPSVGLCKENVPGGHRLVSGRQGRRRRYDSGQGDGLYAGRVALAVPHAGGRRLLHRRRQRQRQRRPVGSRSLPDRAPRSAARRLADRSDGSARRAVGAAWPDLRTLVRGGGRPPGSRTGDRGGRPRPAASLPFDLADGRAVGVVALGAGGAQGTVAQAGAVAAAGLVDPLSRLRGLA